MCNLPKSYSNWGILINIYELEGISKHSVPTTDKERFHLLPEYLSKSVIALLFSIR